MGDELTRMRERLATRVIAANHIGSDLVADALWTVPRHLFLPDLPPEVAYRDDAIVTKRDADGLAISSSSQPGIMAITRVARRSRMRVSSSPTESSSEPYPTKAPAQPRRLRPWSASPYPAGRETEASTAGGHATPARPDRTDNSTTPAWASVVRQNVPCQQGGRARARHLPLPRETYAEGFR